MIVIYLKRVYFFLCFISNERGKREGVFLPCGYFGLRGKPPRWAGEKWDQANWQYRQWVLTVRRQYRHSPRLAKEVFGTRASYELVFVSEINSNSNNLYATSKKKQTNCCQWAWKHDCKLKELKGDVLSGQHFMGCLEVDQEKAIPQCFLIDLECVWIYVDCHFHLTR